MTLLYNKTSLAIIFFKRVVNSQINCINWKFSNFRYLEGCSRTSERLRQIHAQIKNRNFDFEILIRNSNSEKVLLLEVYKNYIYGFAG